LSDSTLLIATDEAGYGPKLGPLVIVATAWKIPPLPEDRWDDLFEPLRAGFLFHGKRIVVNDSKAVYKPGDGLDSLHAAISASHQWCGRTETHLGEILPTLSPQDVKAIEEAPWLNGFDQTPFVDASETHDLLSHWRSTGIEQLSVLARVITAKSFNATCDKGYNKADLLSESTLGLVRNLLERHKEERVAVFCDRHGGRRYYGGVLQHTFPDIPVQVVSEEKGLSRYSLSDSTRSMDIRFTVKGDSFTPVAMSSIHAKYLRERMMGSFNSFFQSLHRGKAPIVPTAGYPVDADRFLTDVEPIIKRENIDRDQLIRAR
jgi:hypothetical protein